MTEKELKTKFENLLNKVDVVENNENWENLTCEDIDKRSTP